jgi:amino acid adenylation domain-containing protein/non-ribosomal peptide synthase protein (TIGR01720 family)
MDIDQLLIQFENNGIQLWVENDRLAYRATKGALTAELRSQLQKYKTEIITFLQGTALKAQDSIPIVSRESDLQLSLTQQRLWFLYQLEGASGTYNLSGALSLEGSLDITRLEKSLAYLVDRHETLRTCFPTREGKPTVKILNERFKLTRIDLNSLSDNEKELRSKQILNEEASRPFDLEKESLFRGLLIGLKAEKNILLLTMHHIISDGWSIGVLTRELGTLYKAFSENQTSPLPPLPCQYVDFAHWQRSWLKGEVMEKQLRYWQDQLSGIPELLELPTDFPRPAVQSYKGDELSFSISTEITSRLKELSTKTGSTLFMILLSAFSILLSRYSRQDDIVIGSPIAGRNHSQTASLIGFFVNTLVFRLNPQGDISFEEFLKQTRKLALEAYNNQDIPFENLVEKLNPERSLSHSPLFQVMFVLLNIPVGDLELSGLKLSSLKLETKIADFDLTLSLMEGPDGLTGSLEYSTALFELSTIQRMVGHLKLLIEGISENPQQKLRELPFMTDGDQKQLLAWNKTEVEYPPDKTIVELFEQQVEKNPAAIAVVFEDQNLSYRELNTKANQLAHYLQSLGVKPEVLVGICVERSLEMIIGLLGILKAGGAYIPLDPVYPTERLAFMLEDTQVPVLVTQSSLKKALPETKAQLVFLDETKLSQLSNNPSSGAAGPDNLAYVIYTSGSTGKPKGVMVEHLALSNFIHSSINAYSIVSYDRILQFASVTFDAAAEEIYPTLLQGATLILRTSEMLSSTETFLTICDEQKLTVLDLPTAYWHKLLTDIQTKHWPKSIRLVLIGGEAVSGESLRQWLENFGHFPTLVNTYGPTEATVVATLFQFSVNNIVTVSIGQPIANTRIYIIDPQHQLQPPGIPGELCIAGAGLARGYLNRPNLTAEKFISNPFGDDPGCRLYKSGDLARYLPDGNIEFLGRIDNQVKIRGFRIELREIESVLGQYPLIKEGVVVVHESSRGDKRLVAYLVIQPDKAFEIEDVRNYLKGYLPDYMMPSNFITLDALPLTPSSGKVDRRKLSLLPVTGVSEKAFVAPNTPNEKRLAEIWIELLDLEKVGIHDNFFEVGGDSIVSIQVISRAKQQGLSLTPKQIFQYQTIAELAQVAGAVGVVTTLAEQGLITGNVELTPIQDWFFEQGFVEENHFNQSAFLNVSPNLSAEGLEKIVSSLVEHHDILRARFSSHGAQWITEDCSYQIDVKDLSAFSSEEQDNLIEATTEALQKSLNIEKGPLFRVALFQLGPDSSNRLFIVIHHLAVDGVSWRILLEDVTTAFYQLENGDSINLPAKTTSYQQWAKRLKDSANSEMITGERDYWLNESRKPVQPLPKDVLTERDLDTQTNQVVISLSQEETARLLKEVHGAYGTQINDLLLAALVQSITWWTHEETLLIDLEGHGREALFDDVDLSRTVGWFTAIFPVCLDIRGVETPGEILKRVKEQLRAIPNHGSSFGLLRYLNSELSEQLQSFPQPQVSFNYLGQFDTTSSNKLFLGTASERIGADVSPLNATDHILDINGFVGEEQLYFSWTYDNGYFKESTLEQVANRFKTDLIAFINHCKSMVLNGYREYTPSDFPLADINQATLDKIVAATGNLEDIYPLSPMQEGMLFHALYDPDSSAYFEQINICFEGMLNQAFFQKAWETVVNRYEVLRSACVWGNICEGLEKPHLKVFTSVSLPWVSEDWRGDDKQDQKLKTFLEDDRKNGFDLAVAPLMRFALIQMADDKFQFVWSSHHLLMDGWCLPIIIKDLFSVYDAFCNNVDFQLSQPGRYRDYIAWLSRQDIEKAKEFWKTQFKGFSSPTSLRLYKGSSKGSEEYNELTLTLPTETTRPLQAFIKAHHLTMNILLQGAWSLLLSRYSGEEEVLFGATVSGRPSSLEGVEAMVGLFINTLPVRVSVTTEEPLVPWLSRLHKNQVERETYGYLPLVEIQKCSEIASNVPLFESLLVFENYPIDNNTKPMDDGYLSIDSAEAFEQTNYPLTLIAALTGDDLVVRFSYSTTHFDKDAIYGMMAHLKTLLEGMVTEDKRPVEIEMLTDREKNQLLAWNKTETEYPQDKTIVDLFEEQVEKTPDAIAVVFDDKNLAYRELNEKANRLAHYLQNLGVKPEVLVGICVERTLEMIIGLLGILKAGGAYVPFDPSYPPERLQVMLEDSEVKVLLSQSHLQERLPTAKVICLDNEWEQIATASGENPLRQSAPNNLAYVLFTSGSTGKPKGVMIEHKSTTTLIQWALETFRQEHLAGVLASTSINFDLSVYELFVPLCEGGQVFLVENALALPTLAQREAITLINTVPSAIAELSRIQGIPNSVKVVNLAGEPLKNPLVQTIYQQETIESVYNLYGPSEDTTYSTFTLIPKTSDKEVNIGRPIANTQIYILDANHRLTPPGIPGELCIAGAGLARGYLNRPELTAEKFLEIELFGQKQRVYKTGDLARWLPDGNLDYLGRLDYQVKLRGFRIELGEIETALSQHEAIKEAVVVLYKEDSPRLVAYVTLIHKAFEIEGLRDYLKDYLPDYMVPSSFITLDALPLTPNGKIDRRKLSILPINDYRVSEKGFIAPRTPEEELLANIWSTVLGVPKMGIHDDFFELGGHSLLATQVISRVRDTFAVDMPLRVIFESPTIEGFCENLKNRRHESSLTPMEAIDRLNPLQLSFAQQRLWFINKLEGASGTYNITGALSLEGPLDPTLLENSLEPTRSH